MRKILFYFYQCKDRDKVRKISITGQKDKTQQRDWIKEGQRTEPVKDGYASVLDCFSERIKTRDR
jgi:hypothetical protein